MTQNKAVVLPDPSDLPDKARKWARAVNELLREQHYAGQSAAINLVAVQKTTAAVQTATETQASKIAQIENSVNPTADPPVPTTPILASATAVIVAQWDGEFTDPDADRSGVSSLVAEYSTTETGDYAQCAYPFVNGSVTIQASEIGASVGDTVWIRFFAQGFNGVKSASGTAASVVVAGVSQTETDDTLNQAIQDAIDGADNAVVSYVDEWAQNSDPSTAPTTGWSTTPPAWVSGSYIWHRVVTTKGSGAVTTGNAVVVTGNDGPQGPPGNTFVSANWTYQTGTTAPPGTGSVRTDSPVTTLWLSTTDANGFNRSTGLALAEEGDDLYISASDGSSYLLNINGTPVDNSTYWAYPVELVTGDPSPKKGTTVQVALAKQAVGADGIGVTSVIYYYQLAASAPAVPTTDPPGGSWTTDEPAYVSGSTDNLYYTIKVTYTDATYFYSDVQLSSTYEAAKDAKLTADGKNRIFVQTTEPTGEAAGDQWWELDSGDPTQIAGVHIWDGTDWNDYLIVADSILVPSSVGSVLIADGAVTASKVNTASLWADSAFIDAAQVNVLEAGIITTTMLAPSVGDEISIAGNVTIIAAQDDINAASDAASAANAAAGNAASDAADALSAANNASSEAGAAQATADDAALAAADAQSTASDTADTVSELTYYYSFTNDGAVISTPGNQYSLKLKSDRIEMLEGTTVLAYWQGGAMVVDNISTDSARIGNHVLDGSTAGQTIWRPV